MADDPEPAVNISGGPDGGGRVVPGGDDGAATRAAAVVDCLGDLYWRKAYGGQDAFTCLVRTILSQNTGDVASQPAHDALLERYGPQGDPLLQGIAGADRETLASTIRPAGLYNRKARVLVGAAHEVLEAFGDAEAFDDFVKEGDPAAVRDRLLSIEGVGPKTADCVLLFAGGRDGVFPVKTNYSSIGFILKSGV